MKTIKNVSNRKILIFLISLFYLQSWAQLYSWKTVRVGGGGATTSMQAHPLVQNLYFITTDVGTPYRWNDLLQRWEGLTYGLGTNFWGSNAAGNIAFDPSDITGNILFATLGGQWTNGTLLKSIDRGNTWVDCNLTLDVKPNYDQWAGQRLAVDPQNSSVVYVTTRASNSVTSINGTFKSTSNGIAGSWQKTNNLCGSFLLFDISAGLISGVTKNIYIGCSDGVYQSVDGGATFSLMVGSPQITVRGAIHSNGTLYVTTTTGVFKWNGNVWATISPTTGNSYQAVAVNPQNSNQVIVGINSYSPFLFTQFLSSNGGATWTAINPVKDNTEVPWFNAGIGAGLDDFCWDPFNQNMVWFTDFFNAHQTINVWAGNNVTWKARAAGHEEIVPTGNLLCPPSGVNMLLSNVADVGGWDHPSITASPNVGMMQFFPWSFSGEAGNMSGVAVQESNPNFIARVGRHGWNGAGYAGCSDNGGLTYTIWACPPNASGGRVAVSSTTETIVWVTQDSGSFRSVDRGITWSKINSLPDGIIGGSGNIFSTAFRFPLVADKVNGDKFYVYAAGIMYVSIDGGITFTPAANLPNLYVIDNLTLETTPGVEGDVWLALAYFGLYHSTNSGNSFTQINNVQRADFVAFGKASPQTPNTPALYIYGTLNNQANGLFRSNDNGQTWDTIACPLPTGNGPSCMAADRQVYGRVFFGVLGNGFFVVEPNTITTTSSGNHANNDQGISIFPNPVSQNNFLTTISGYEQSEFLNLTLTDLSGKLVRAEKVKPNGRSKQIIEMNTQNLDKGLYILSVISEYGKQTKKLIITGY